jgi:hypothetical protein
MVHDNRIPARDHRRGGPGPFAPDSKSEDQFLIAYTGRTVTGFQMRTSAERSSAVMGAEGNPALALKKSIDYLEIYEPDVLADDTQSDLRYAASLFAR